MLRNTTTRFPTSVANRFGGIPSVSSPSQWRFVSGKDNPADIASRGSGTNPSLASTWFIGPRFVSLEEEHWPLEPRVHPDEEADIRQDIQVNATTSSQPHFHLLQRLSIISSWTKLLRTVAWLITFCEWLCHG